MFNMITILGPTASGKTPLAAALACRLGSEGMPAEIISADSRQVYRRLDIGTGKDLSDYHVVGDFPADIPYHLIDICEPGTKYNLFQYLQDFNKTYQDIKARGAFPILCGGTGLYIEAVLKGYELPPVPENPELRKHLEGRSLKELTAILTELKAKNGTNMHNTTDVDTCQRAIRAIEIEACANKSNSSQVMGTDASQGEQTPLGEGGLVIGINIDRELRREKISRRLRTRLDEGMVEEVRALLDSGIPPENLIYYGLEYKFVTEYLIGKTTYDEMFSRLEIAIHQFAKRQMTWFRGMERRGFTIHWIDATTSMEDKVNAILSLFMQSWHISNNPSLRPAASSHITQQRQ